VSTCPLYRAEQKDEKGGGQELSEQSKKQGGRRRRVTSLGNQFCDVLFPAQWLVTRQGPSIHPVPHLHTPVCVALGHTGDDADMQTSAPGKAPSGGRLGLGQLETTLEHPTARVLDGSRVRGTDI